MKIYWFSFLFYISLLISLCFEQTSPPGGVATVAERRDLFVAKRRLNREKSNEMRFLT